MSGGIELEALLRSMRPKLHQDQFVFCTLKLGAAMPNGVVPIMTFQEDEGLTLIIERSMAEAASLEGEFPSRKITLNVHSSLHAVGFLAAITNRLAAAGMGVNPVSAFYHDHLFVPADRAESALALLNEMARR